MRACVYQVSWVTVEPVLRGHRARQPPKFNHYSLRLHVTKPPILQKSRRWLLNHNSNFNPLPLSPLNFLPLSLSRVYTLTHRYTTRLFVTFFYPPSPWTSEKTDKRDWSSLVSPNTPLRRPMRSYPCWRLGTGIVPSTRPMPMLPRLVPMLYSRSVSH